MTPPPRPRNKENRGLEAGVTTKNGSYYFIAKNKWHKLCRVSAGKIEMRRALNELKSSGAGHLVGMFERYRREILPEKSASTIKDYAPALDKLQQGFGHLHTIRPVDVAAMHDKVGERSHAAANRYLSVLSSVCKYGVRWGYIDANPCRDIQRFKAVARKHYIEHSQFLTVVDKAPKALRIAMWLAYYTGQRQSDIISLHRSQLRDDGIYFKTAKTGAEAVITWSPGLAAIVDEAKQQGNMFLVCKSDGGKYSSYGFQSAWQRFNNQLPESERLRFQDIRSKSAKDHDTGAHLLHSSEAVLKKHYRNTITAIAPAPSIRHQLEDGKTGKTGGS